MSSIFDVTVYNKTTGEVVSSGTTQLPETLETATLGVLIGELSVPRESYVSNNVICKYTDAELSARDNLPLGWIWKMPERIAIDPRTDDQRATAATAVISAARAAAYPPMTDLADALYWQSTGDQTKMTAYLAACEAVKQRYPL
jgi:hypothetical protein